MADGPLHVMMVEDNDNDYALLADACRRQRVPCMIERHATGTQGWAALLAARDAGALPGMIILDLDLPGIAGFELLERMRADEKMAALPVMMLTGSIARDDREYCAAADHYFIKPRQAEGWITITSLLAAYAMRKYRPAADPDSAAKRRMPNLLHIEDNADDRFLFSLAFARSGLRGMLHQVSSADDALAFLCKEVDYHDAPTPDIIVLDLGLSGGDGRSFLANLRGDPRFRVIPVIILTGSERYDDIEICRDLLVIDYVIKPQTSQQLSEFIGTFRQWMSSSMSGVAGPAER
jgi:chemotaxis family two-component system response regulator Rcp1